MSPVSRTRKLSKGRPAKRNVRPPSPLTVLVREMRDAAEESDAYLAEIVFSDLMAGHQDPDELLAQVLRDAERRGNVDAALVVRLIARIGPMHLRERASALDSVLGAELEEWTDNIGRVSLRSARRFTTMHHDADLVLLEFAYDQGDSSRHTMMLHINQVLGGVTSLELLGEPDDRFALEAANEFLDDGGTEIAVDDDYKAGRLATAFRLGMESFDFGLDDDVEDEWLLGMHRIGIATGVDIDAMPWPPADDVAPIEAVALEMGAELHNSAELLNSEVPEPHLTECLRWLYHYTMSYGGRDPRTLSPESVRFVLTSALQTDWFCSTTTAPWMPQTLEALARLLADQDDWPVLRLEETLAAIDEYAPPYLADCEKEGRAPDARRVKLAPDLDFSDAVAVRAQAFGPWPSA